MIDKSPHICVAPEEMEAGTIYAVTLNPRENHDDLDMKMGIYNVRCKHRPRTNVLHVKKRLRDMSIGYRLVFEVSSTGRIHYHGWLVVHDVEKFFLEDILILKCCFTFCIKPIKEHAEWARYVTKSIKRWGITFSNARWFPACQERVKELVLVDEYDDNNVLHYFPPQQSGQDELSDKEGVVQCESPDEDEPRTEL